MMRFALISVIVIALFAEFNSSANASIVASWNLTGDAGSQATEPALAGPAGITGNDMTRGAGLAASAAGGSFSSSDWDDNTADEFMQFGFTIAAGYTVDLTSLTIATRSSATGPGMMGLFTSLDSYAAAVHTFNQSPGANFVNTIVDLSSLALLTSGPFSVRLIEVGNTQADGTDATAPGGTFRIAEYVADGGTTSVDVQFEGNITAPSVVPEASAILVWAMICGSVVVGLRQCRQLV